MTAKKKALVLQGGEHPGPEKGPFPSHGLEVQLLAIIFSKTHFPGSWLAWSVGASNSWSRVVSSIPTLRAEITFKNLKKKKNLKKRLIFSH